MNESYSIYLLDKTDEDALCEAAEVINEAFLKQLAARTDRQTITIQELKIHLSDPSKEAFALVNRNHQIIGIALITLESTYVYIWCVSIATAHQGSNLGLKLMLFIEKRSYEVHKKKLAVLSVVYHPLQDQSHLVHWYERQGYLYSHEQIPSNVAEIWKPEFHNGLTLRVFHKILTPS